MPMEIIPDETMITDRLALSRAQHLKFRDTRVKSVSDDEIDGISDWSESDRECCPVSDFESTSNADGNHYDMPFDDDDDDEEVHLHQGLLGDSTLLENVLRLNETPLPTINDSTTSTRISFSSDVDKPKEHQQQIQERALNLPEEKPTIQIRKQSQPPLLPARRLPAPQRSLRRSITTSHVLPPPPPSTNLLRSRKTITASPSRFSFPRETTSTNLSLNVQLIKDSSLSPNSSFHSNDDNQHHQRQTASPNLSQISNINGPVPRVYELKKLFVDDHDYGRLTDVSILKPVPPRNRQKWGTIVHPPFPLGYQQITSEQVTQAVERLASPVRCRDRHTPVQTPSKRYLSVEETDALVS